MSRFDLTRRRIIQAAGAGLLLPGLAPAVIASVKDRPKMTDGVQSGDVLGDRAMVWSRSDRPARMVVEWDTRSMFTQPRRAVSLLADQRTDFTARQPIRPFFTAYTSKTLKAALPANRGSAICAACRSIDATSASSGAATR
jgi:hypothetical protein